MNKKRLVSFCAALLALTLIFTAVPAMAEYNAHVQKTDAGRINPFYADQVYTLETNIHFMADGYIDSGKSVSVNVSYQCTCNNDHFFSVLVRKESVIGDVVRTVWTGHTFSRQDGLSDATFDLPRLLGILNAGEQDEYQLARQTEKASRIVREMIMTAKMTAES